ncbi:DUF4190 domain-containing protein [Mycobacterium attenuatum]|uniref:DUF4190 domain-containing protein n=1 Tax=Mycobacterium attenuatum TaxID=2341086 RepID=UPI000F029A00|nr:DUF4190 domain-containing protein [Mycobacterium attenuatum]VBA60611.1 hypothetical protein LAUMK191_05610 [Mycobacterium attenuatum]VBA62362.1 hypothetical protein LAUMK41_05753 [Mycobacterium attenuatum]
MNHAGDPFRQDPADQFGTSSGPPAVSYPQPGGDPWPVGGNAFPTPPVQKPSLDTFAVLSSILAVPMPPAAVVLGHLALPRIRRTGERGRLAAILGLVIGYLMCVVLLAGAIWVATTSRAPSSRNAATPTPSAPSLPASTSTSTSIVTVPPSIRPRVKLDLSQAAVGTCVEIQRRGTQADELDLFKVDCEHRQGVYVVAARVNNQYECKSTYIAAPPDRAFAVCLNLY